MGDVHRTSDVVEFGDGTRLEVSVFEADPTSAAPVALCVPAMGVQARSYVRVAQALAEAGCIAVTADLRGHGLSSVRPSRHINFGYHEMVSIDLAGLTAWARERFDGHPLFLLGHSLGGQLGALLAASHPGRLDGLVLVAACSVHFKGWPLPHRLGVLAGSQATRVISALWGHFPGKTFSFAATEARGVMGDWANNALTGRYDLAHATEDYEGRLTGVDIPVLAVTFDGDLLGPRQASENLLHKLESATLSRLHFDRATQGSSAGHFGWLRSPEFVVRPILDWIRSLQETRP